MSAAAEVTRRLEHVDVLIVGAGVSGIDLGHHLKTKQPGRTFAIVDGRDAIGGTWDLFRYPGIRSDADMQSFGFEFKPWTKDNAIADAHEILVVGTALVSGGLFLRRAVLWVGAGAVALAAALALLMPRQRKADGPAAGLAAGSAPAGAPVAT